jgi:S-adenosylmethionine/arginine decarboxylase-like enzyme
MGGLLLMIMWKLAYQEQQWVHSNIVVLKRSHITIQTWGVISCNMTSSEGYAGLQICLEL